MQARVLVEGAKGFLSFLLRTLLFPLVWVWALALARKHEDTDPRGRSKVVVAIVAGVVLAGAGFYILDSFQKDSTHGMYEELGGRLAQSTGEAEYQDQVSTVAATDNTLQILARNLAAAEAAGDQDNVTLFKGNIADAEAARATALLKQTLLTPNHDLFVALGPKLEEHHDAGAKALIADFAATMDDSHYRDGAIAPIDKIAFDVTKLESRSDRAFEIKDKAQHDMAMWMDWLFLPGLVGVLFAPLSFALGHVLKNAWEPSETVGYKEYPGTSMAWFLLLGAFGVPALFFAAWTFWDMDVRSTEGQIAL